MSAYTFGAALQPTTSPKITSPPAVKKKGTSAAPLESAVELQDYMQQVQTQHSEHEHGTTPKTPNEIEMSRPPSPTEVAEFVPSWSFPAKNKYRVSAICLVYLANGLTDACE